MRSISIINTGIQVVNVVEALRKNGCTENYLIIGQFNLHPDRIKQIEIMLKDDFLNSNFKKIYGLPKQFSPKNPLRFISYILTYIKFAFIILRAKKYDFCFFGVYTDIIMRPIVFLSWFKNRKIKINLIDEGVRVITDAANRVKQLKYIEKQKQRKTLFVRDFYLAITRKWIPPQITYFSVYDLPLSGDDNIELNEYGCFKNNNPYKYSFESGAVVIIGQPYVELNIIKQRGYEEILEKIFTDYAGKKFYYFPHPMETIYTSLIPSGINIIRSQYPVELLLLGAKIDAIVGFNSSVLYNAAKMKLCDDISSYMFNDEHYINAESIESNKTLAAMFGEARINIRN